MITVENREKFSGTARDGLCFSCGKDCDVYKITFDNKYQRGSTIIDLCADCMEILKDEIEEALIQRRMAGMKIEVVKKLHYEVQLSDEDVKLVKDRIMKRCGRIPDYDLEDYICDDVMELYNEGKIKLYEKGKLVEGYTDSVNWSEHESRSPYEILGVDDCE